MGEFVRNETVDGGLQCGGSDQMRLVAVAPGMQNLQGDFAAFLMYGFGNGAMVGIWLASLSIAPPSMPTPVKSGAIPLLTINATP